MRDHHRKVDVVASPFGGVHEFGEGFPVPVEPGGGDRLGNVLHPLHQFDQFASIPVDRRETDAAVAAHDCRDAVREARIEAIVLDELRIIVAVNVDEPGGDDGAIRFDYPVRWCRYPADLGDQTIGNPQVSD